MLTFQQFCEHELGLHSWFYLKKQFLPALTPEELSLVYVEPCTEDLVRIWYPKDKWYNRPLSQEEVKRQLMLALSDEDYERVKELKQKLQKIVTRSAEQGGQLTVVGLKPEEFEAHGITRR